MTLILLSESNPHQIWLNFNWNFSQNEDEFLSHLLEEVKITFQELSVGVSSRPVFM